MSFGPMHEYNVQNIPETESGAEHRNDVDVLIIGAGPTGLTAACEAIRHGLSVRIVDRKPCRSTFSKALVVHARTLEVFETMGVAEEILADGTRFTALNVNTRRRSPVRVDLLGLPWGDTAYPFWLSIPQYATERVLESQLNQEGGRVEWGVALEEISDNGDHVAATLEPGNGRREVVRARWLIGCDGGRSRVRDAVGLRLDRSDAGATFVLADIKTTSPLIEDEGHVFLAPEGLLLIVPMPEPRRWRIIAHVPQARKEASLLIDEAFLDDLIRRRSGIEFGSHDIAWTSQFQLSHGLADHYRRGRVFLAGDAAHIHSPVGGQGLNTGVQDAHNLLWKLAVARRAGTTAANDLLDSYEAERRPVAHAMVRGTARATSALTTRKGVPRALLGLLAPTALAQRSVQSRFGRGVGMLDIAYCTDSSTVGGTLAVGRRMPNPRLGSGVRLHHRLAPLGFSWVARGRPGETHPDSGDPRWAGIPVVFLPDEELEDLPGLTEAAPVVLVRPDRYIAATGRSPASVLSAVETPILLYATLHG
ncbi:FAD-dependent monooxygenase [Streptomyces cupreus]|uniref:FAD-dependent monooxygenase n=1 Tax=Streptomyces cupreus TaxID=2759956 RepID=A0A7X1JCT2_9ACTN|nr:FAD-dependent monooxygenase [Streptomyces cupreus]MBC2907412.1 FAD-dependent monooxygenase [Streptomyces cupreus]